MYLILNTKIRINYEIGTKKYMFEFQMSKTLVLN